MLEKLLPRETNFFDFFNRQAAIIVQASHEFYLQISEETFDCCRQTNPIKVLEHQADEVVHQCLEALHKTFITPIDRDHIYRLISVMDDIIDAINAAYNNLIIYKITKPTSELEHFGRIVHLSTLKVEQVVRSLQKIPEGEFLTSLFVEIHHLENEADDLLHHALANLFEKEEDARQIIKWKDIYESLEEATDRCEDVTDVVQTIILESL